ncbi:sulfatase [Nocardioides sp. JQ2195]|uniref:sulfatase family protein n=1 Tax=Nocardioides sp. JQ2195 TaxID=2592334 RepID=UPI00143E951B|nr:sulfatase [Nocardioides sp. JQ2195]QIX26930.1 sulfatase [Nocardioides sp. JQ2195]
MWARRAVEHGQARQSGDVMRIRGRVALVAAGAALLAGGLTVVNQVRHDAAPQAAASDPAADGSPTHTVYVDNSGSVVSVSVRDATEPWQRSMTVTVNDHTTTLDRSNRTSRTSRTSAAPNADEPCEPRITAEPTSLLTRLDLPRSCITGSHHVRVFVSEDGGPPVKVEADRLQRPNVLMIMVDDMRADDLRWMPNVRRLIGDRGVTFTNGFASLPLCCPARASVLTGQYPHNHQVWSQVPPWGFTAFDDSSTLPVWLKGAGYRTSYMGKYLNEYGTGPEPGRTAGTSTQYVPPGWDTWQASIDGGLDPSDPNDGGTYRYFDTTLNDNGRGYISLEGQYQTDAYARLTSDVIQEAAGESEPFFHYVSFSAPHVGGPREPDDPTNLATPARPQRLWGSFDQRIRQAPGAHWRDRDQSDKPNRMKGHISRDTMAQVLELARQRAEALRSVDHAVKRMMGRLRRTGELGNTAVVFTSDNGFFLGEQNIPSGKVLPYEPSLRVPVLMRGPGIPRGEVRSDPFLSIDFAETLADLADARVPGSTDGRSLIDVARLGDESRGDAWSRVVLTETPPNKLDTRRLKRRQPVGAHSKKMLQGRVTGIRTGRYLYTEWNYDPGVSRKVVDTELYDVVADPEQYENLATQPGREELIAQLHEVLADARTCRGDGCRALLPENLR